MSYPICTHQREPEPAARVLVVGENPAAAALIGNLDLHTDVGTQDYRGLKLSFQRRAASGVSLNGNYTLSRCFGDPTIQTGGFPQIAQRLHRTPTTRRSTAATATRTGRTSASFNVGAQTPQFDNRALRALSPRTGGCRASSAPVRAAGSTSSPAATTRSPASSIQRVNQVATTPYGDEDADAAS